MKTLLFYLLQVIVTSGILYGYYHFALRNKRFHKYNRFYLLAATVVSMGVPFLNIPVYFTQSDADSSFVLQTLTVFSAAGSDNSTVFATSAETHSNWFTWQNLSWLIYMLIAFIVLLRIIFSLLKIRRIVKNNPAEKLDTIRFVNTTEPGTPFSFFRWLFWNKKIELHSEKGEQVFRHELFHIEQKHSRDTIYMELLTVVFWINPFFYLIKKEVKAIHEFLADQFAVSENTKWQYAELLLMQAFNTNQHLVNPFFHNQIKRRIAMITTSKKPGHQYLRKLMVLPVAAIVMGLFAFTYKKKQEENLKQSLDVGNNIKTGADTTNKLSVDGADHVKINSGKLNINTAAPNDTTNKPLIVLDGEKHEYNDGILKDLDPGIIERVNVLKGPSAILKYGEWGKNGVIEIITKKETKKEVLDNMVFDKVEIDPSFSGGNEKWKHYLERNLDASVPEKKKAQDGAYTVVIQFIVDKEGNISDAKALTNHRYGMEEEALRVIKASPKWNPAIQNGHIVKAYKKQPITFFIYGDDKKIEDNPKKIAANPHTTAPFLDEVVVVDFTRTQKPFDKIFDKVETPPSFPGGDSAWKRYLLKNCRVSTPVDSGAPAGTYKVLVQFIVREDGFLENIKSLTNHGYGMEDEVIRLIKKGPLWIPAIQNGHIVRAYMQQPVTFEISEDPDAITKNSKTTLIQNTTKIPEISVKELQNIDVYKLLQLPKNTEIISYEFSIDMPNNEIVVAKNTGNQFSNATKTQINNATPGRVIAIDNIRIRKDGEDKKITARVYKLVG